MNFVYSAIFLILLILPTAGDAQSLAAETEYATTVLCGNGKTYRLTAPAQLSICGNYGDLKPILVQFVTDFNSICTGNRVQLSMAADNNDHADIVFRVVPSSFINATVKFTSTNVGSLRPAETNYHTEINYYTTPQASAMLPYVKRGIYHNLLKAIGFTDNRPVQQRGSIWAISQFVGDTSMAMDLTPLDKKLIRFTYEFVQPGLYVNDVRVLVQKHWSEVRVDPERSVTKQLNQP